MSTNGTITAVRDTQTHTIHAKTALKVNHKNHAAGVGALKCMCVQYKPSVAHLL